MGEEGVNLENCSSLKSIFLLPHIWKKNDTTEREGAGASERGGIVVLLGMYVCILKSFESCTVNGTITLAVVATNWKSNQVKSHLSGLAITYVQCGA